MYHKMGAGKTLSLLNILMNRFKQKKETRCVVFGPKNVLTDFHPTSSDVSLIQDADNFFLKRYERGMYALKDMAEFEVLVSSDKLAAECAGKIICIDEAHNVVQWLRRNPTKVQAVYDAMDRAQYVILMTGTPVINRMSDFTALLKLLGPTSCDVLHDLPCNDSQFAKLHQTRSEADHDLEFNHFKKLGTALSGWGFVRNGLGQNAIKGMINAAIPGARLVSEVGAFYAAYFAQEKQTYGVQHWKTVIQNNRYRSTDDKKLAALKNYVSFFDYNNLLPTLPGGEVNKTYYAFPTIATDAMRIEGASYVPVQVPLTEFQSQLLLRMQSIDPEFGLTGQDRKTLALSDYDDISSTDIFERAACMLGATALPTEVPTRFVRAHQILTQYRAQKEVKVALKDGVYSPPHNQMYDVNLIYKGRYPRALLAKNGHGVRMYRAIDPKNMKRKKSAEALRFLPVVAFVNISTMERFKLYLEANEEAYITVTPDNLGTSVAQAWQPYPLGDGPICVVMHPDVIEGTSLTMNPCLIAMEVRDGHGIQEQVFARILRRHGVDEAAFENGPPTRFDKKIYLMVATPNTAARDKQREVNKNARSARLWSDTHGAAVQRAKEAVGNFFNMQYDDTRYHNLSNNPEAEVIERNKEQGRTLEALGKLFVADSTITCAVCKT